MWRNEEHNGGSKGQDQEISGFLWQHGPNINEGGGAIDGREHEGPQNASAEVGDGA